MSRSRTMGAGLASSTMYSNVAQLQIGDKLQGGAPLGINLVHDIDLICYLLGPISHVQATTSNIIRKYDVEDTAVVNLTFKSGTLFIHLLNSL